MPRMSPTNVHALLIALRAAVRDEQGFIDCHTAYRYVGSVKTYYVPAGHRSTVRKSERLIARWKKLEATLLGAERVDVTPRR